MNAGAREPQKLPLIMSPAEAKRLLTEPRNSTCPTIEKYKTKQRVMMRDWWARQVSQKPNKTKT
jgi:hypothetical protein